jgi:prepilin-type processing-associated H-X9-DG protein
MCATWLGFQGVPTTYLANNIFFGFDAPWRPIINSLRFDQIDNISQKDFIIEGGLAYAKDTNGEPEYVYYNLGDISANQISKSTGEHRLNYVHDSNGSFWIMPGSENWNHFPNMWTSEEGKAILANKFNIAFANKAEMIVDEAWGCSIISYIDPFEKPFDAFFVANPPNATMNHFDFYDASEYHYLVGKMNVMFGDGSVLTKDQAWLYANKQKFGQITKD